MGEFLKFTESEREDLTDLLGREWVQPQGDKASLHAYLDNFIAVWRGLGYDFVRFASALGAFPAAWTPEMVNERLSGGPRVDYSLAPLAWDKTGQASQQMFLFTPEQGGPAPADPAQFQDRMQKADQRRTYRVKILRDQFEAKQKKAQSQGKPAGQSSAGAAPVEDND